MTRLWNLLRRVFRGEPIIFAAPPIPAGAVCAQCGEPAVESWYPQVCALASEPKAWAYLCARHDVELNEHTVRFLCGDRYESALARYRADAIGGRT